MKTLYMSSSLSGGLVMLGEMKSKLPPSERKIATYVLENPGDAVLCTANELGERSSTSGAAVIRLCKSLGLKGFQELKIRIAGDLQRPMEERYRDIHPDETPQSLLFKMANNSIQAIKETSEILSTDELTKAVKALSTARNIHFFGVGASGIIAQDAQQKFLRINKQATAFADTHMAATLAANSTKEDVLFGISYLGQTAEVVEFLRLGERSKATTISLTRYGPSPVSKTAEINLFTSASTEATFRSGATSSRLAQLHVIDVLFMCVATEQYDESIKYLDQTREAIMSHRVPVNRGGSDSEVK